MTAHLAETPVLETERLILRAPRMADYPVWEAFFASDRARYIGGPGGQHIAWRAFAHVAGMWALRGFGSFVFTSKGSDAALGLAGPWYPMDWPEPEIGWSIWDAEAEGQSLAFEAATAAKAHAVSDLGWTTAVSYIDADNARSIALAERLGAVRDDAAPCPESDGPMPVLVYRHAKTEALT